MLIKLYLVFLITLLFYIKNKLDCKKKILLNPIIITPIVGLLWGVAGFNTGITIGGIVELLWGRNSLKDKRGLKYNSLISLLTLSVVLLTENISLFFNLTLIVILVFAFQESLGYLNKKSYFLFIIFIFNSIIIFSVPLLKELLGSIPAEFLNQLAISGGALVPLVGLSLFLIEALKENGVNNKGSYYSYGIFSIITVTLLFNSFYWALVIFPGLYYFFYLFWKHTKVNTGYLRLILLIVVLISTPLIVEWNVPILSGQLQYILWIEVILSLFSLLFLFELTAIEGYFIICLIGIVFSKFGILL